MTTEGVAQVKYDKCMGCGVCEGHCTEGAAVLLRMAPTPVGGWAVIAGWGFAGIMAAVIFPWKQWRNVEEWYGAQ